MLDFNMEFDFDLDFDRVDAIVIRYTHSYTHPIQLVRRAMETKWNRAT